MLELARRRLVAPCAKAAAEALMAIDICCKVEAQRCSPTSWANARNGSPRNLGKFFCEGDARRPMACPTRCLQPHASLETGAAHDQRRGSATRLGSIATTTTICNDVCSSSCVCASGGRWSTASACGASSTVPAFAGARDAEVFGTAAVIVSCPTGQQDIARSVSAPSSCLPASSCRGN